VPAFDCSTIGPASAPPVLAARAGRGLAFDDFGSLVGVSEPHLFRSGFDTEPEVFVPNVGELDQIDRLPDGDFALAVFSDNTILRVNPEGGTEVLATDVGAYGVRTGPDGLLYTANGRTIHRIDPANGDRTDWLKPADFAPRVLDFSPALDRMYIGTMESGGAVYAVELDATLDPVGEPWMLVDGLGGWHDGLGVDACGYVYLADYDTLALYRISPDGSQVETLLQATRQDRMYPHGLRWGSGVGGWHEEALYVPQPMNDDTVAEVVVGVPYRDFAGEVVNAP
jgi:hypothetical protein